MGEAIIYTQRPQQLHAELELDLHNVSTLGLHCGTMSKEFGSGCKLVKSDVKLYADDRLCGECENENDRKLAIIRVRNTAAKLIAEPDRPSAPDDAQGGLV